LFLIGIALEALFAVAVMQYDADAAIHDSLRRVHIYLNAMKPFQVNNILDIGKISFLKQSIFI
jgi:hypothetical protein